MQKYDIIALIGQGAYGVVLKCKSRQNSEIVAVKKFKQTEDDEIVRKTALRQVKILKLLKHPNIVFLKQAFCRRGIVYLVFQYVQNNLLEILEKEPEGLDPQKIRSIIYQILKALAHMHSMNMIHRDIKPENILIGEKNQLKICDFGFARQLKKGNIGLTDYVATRWYRPPQLLVGAKYGIQIDLWAVGCIFAELTDGNPMFPGENEFDQLSLIQKCLGPLIPDHYQTFLKNPRYIGVKFPEIRILNSIEKRYLGKFSPKALSLLRQLLRMNPSERLTAVDALKHPYFDGLRQQDLLSKLSSNYTKPENKVEESPIYCNSSVTKKIEKQKMQYRQVNRNQRVSITKRSTQQQMTQQKSKMNFTHGKSLNRGNGMKMKLKNISLQKQHNRDTTKTQNGFYIMGGKGIIHELGNENDSISSLQGRNRIYNVQSIKPKSNPRNRQIPNTESVIQEDEEDWDSNSQLPALIISTNKHKESISLKNYKKRKQPHGKHDQGQQSRDQGSHHFHSSQLSQNSHYHPQPPVNIVITNSTFNCRQH